MLKYASAQIMTKALVPDDASPRELRRFAHRHHFDYEVRPGYLYVRSRAISSRCNDNFDRFPAEELEKAYATFVGKPVFVNHHNDDHKRARGVIIDAALHKDANRDGSPDYWVEVLMEVDAIRFPKLAAEIMNGNIARTSMGCDVAFSVCSACGNKATTPAEYCQHIPASKGMTLYRTTASGHKVGEVIHETCFGLRFFENSLLVEPPADPTAYFLGVDTRGVDKTAAASEETAAHAEPRHAAPYLALPGRAESTQRTAGLDGVNSMRKGAPFAGYDDFEDCTEQNQDKGDPDAYCGEIKHKVEDGKKESRLTLAELMAEGATKEGAAATPPEDHPWFKQTGLSHHHILDHWDAATDEEKAQGKRWYPDAHLVAKSIAKLDPRIKSDAEAAHKGAGVLSAYSPQQGWWANQHNAARAFHEQRAVGKGEGIMVMSSHANAAQKIMDGMPHHEALKGPKTQDFAHLIEHGGYKPQSEEDAAAGKPREHSDKVVVDRHALSVAAGRRLNADDVKGFPSQSRKHYEVVANHYRKAAAVISDREGREVPPHEVQAVTWLARQRLNAEGDTSPGQKGRNTVQRNQRKQWQDLSREHTPELHEADPPNSHVAAKLAYGEQKAPADVDTLREDACPVCGDRDTFDGATCQVCGYVAPPKMFQDPDLEKARQMDLRKDIADFNDPANPMAPGQQQVGPDGQPIDPQEQAGGPMDAGDLDENGNPINPDAADPGAQPGSLPGEVQAEVQPGGDPMDPQMLGPDGMPIDPQGIPSELGAPVDPAMLGPDGQPLQQPGQQMMVGPNGEPIGPQALPADAVTDDGKPFTPGPNMPMGPGEPESPQGPEAPLSPDEVGSEGQIPTDAPGDGQIPNPDAGQGVPGTPGDGVPDLQCPACGFTADATNPVSVDMDTSIVPPSGEATPDGVQAGDVCPNCGAGQLMSPAEMQGQVPVPVPM